MTLGDPRMATCTRKSAKNHTYREGAFWPDGRMRCIYCGYRKRERRERKK